MVVRASTPDFDQFHCRERHHPGRMVHEQIDEYTFLKDEERQVVLSCRNRRSV